MFAIVFAVLCAFFFADLFSLQFARNLINDDRSPQAAPTSESKSSEWKSDCLTVILRLSIIVIFRCTVYQWLISAEILNERWSKIGIFLVLYVVLVGVAIRLQGTAALRKLLARTVVHVVGFGSSISLLIGHLWILTLFWGRHLLHSILEFLISA